MNRLGEWPCACMCVCARVARGTRSYQHNSLIAARAQISHGLRILNSTSTTLQKHWRGRQARASPSASTPPREHDEGSRSSSSVHHDLTYYYVAAGQRMGPVRTANLIAMERSAMLTADTLVWRKGMARPAQTPRHVIILVRKCTCLWHRRRWHKHAVTLVRFLITGRVVVILYGISRRGVRKRAVHTV